MSRNIQSNRINNENRNDVIDLCNYFAKTLEENKEAEELYNIILVCISKLSLTKEIILKKTKVINKIIIIN